VLDTHPTLSFLLIGDSGQEDPEIYRQVVKDYPERILAVYIRDVSHQWRDAEVQVLIQAAQAEQVEMLLVADTVAAAQHAASRGWIDPAKLPSIEVDHQKDQQAPNELEQLLAGE
jgi:phosphatidate phosphatase APP1